MTPTYKNDYDKRDSLERIFNQDNHELSSSVPANKQYETSYFRADRRQITIELPSRWSSAFLGICGALLFTGAGMLSNGALMENLFPAGADILGLRYTQPGFGSTPFVPTSHESLQAGKVNVSKSTMTGIVDSASMSSSLYWTFVLKNNESVNREAAFEIQLPKNAVVSRATLWINGVPQEAAFSSKQAVSNAYDWVALRNRDPLLITQVDTDRIKVLAAPVLANGGEMKVRIGITAPLQLSSDGQRTLELPKVLKSNLTFDGKQDLHISSDTKIGGAGKTEHNGFYLLRANVSEGDLENLKLNVAGPQFHKFATRLTHTNPVEYVVAELEEGELKVTRSKVKPECKIVHDEDLAFRISNLWAHQEIERLVSRGEEGQAINIANVFRSVSSVSGAVVLEQDSDYAHDQLNRDMYAVLSDKKDSHDAFVQGNANAPTLHSGANPTVGPAAPALSGFTGAPTLMGAVNGTIGPQGSDATLIQGVNTAGTVRVNNYLSIEMMANLFAYLMQFLSVLFAVVLGREALWPAFGRSISASKRNAMLLGAVTLITLALTAHNVMKWLIAITVDANILS